jgi:capsular polysaccharide transport system permease protein
VENGVGYSLENHNNKKSFRQSISEQWRPWRKALSVQRQTLSALIFRESRTRFGEQSLGILWAFGEVLMHIFTMWGIWAFFGHRSYDELPTPVFLVTGLLPFFIFRNCFDKTAYSVSGNQSLLVFSQINIFDFALARCILEVAIYISAFVIFIITLYFLKYDITIISPSKIIFAFINTWLLGMGMGLLYLPFQGKLKIVDTLVPVIIRAFYLLSGVFFPIDKVPYIVRKYLEYNPLLHIMNYLRSGFIDDYGQFNDILYSFKVSIFMIMIGLILMKRLRRMILNDD